MDKVQKEQQSLKMNRNNVMVHKQERDVYQFTVGSHGCWPRIVQKVSECFAYIPFWQFQFISCVFCVCRKNRLDFSKLVRMRWRTGWCKEIKVDCFISRTKTDICTILLGSFGNTLAFNSSYIHYSILRCRYIYIYIY